MEEVKEIKNPLETEPISRLILKYSVPTALTLMVNYLYNIVDQMFVGQGVGITGMAATNVAFPLTIIATALGLLSETAARRTSVSAWGGRSRKKLIKLPGMR